MTSKLLELLSRMTLTEKLGQLTQSVGADITAIGTTADGASPELLIRRGQIGSMIQVAPPDEMAEKIRELQRIAVEESRLGIPLLFCQDVIHGFETVFPIPLAVACSFRPEAAEAAYAMAAKEAASAGITVSYAPMVDISRDARWGRIAESAGEDPYLAGVMAAAQVRGLQEGCQNAPVAACLKHFVGYGAAEAGRDYNTVEISDATLQNVYLAPFRAGIEAGAASVMAAFSVMNGVPLTANRHLLTNVLRQDMGFEGVVFSDYSAVDELIAHGVAEDGAAAARKAITAGIDIEMTSGHYMNNLAQQVESGTVDLSLIDAAVLRVLELKEKLGLFDDPYRTHAPKMGETLFCQPHRDLARTLASDCAVLLKNDGILPLETTAKVALVGPFADSRDLCGCWSFSFCRDKTVTIAEGLRAAGFDTTTEQGCQPQRDIEGGIERATSAALDADVIVLALGETSEMSGEACSRQSITIPKPQRRLAKAMASLGKPCVLLLTNGRPLLLDWYDKNMNAILELWAPGSEGGNAAADMLLGRREPSGRLCVTFPRHTGQLPIYYNALATGRPYTEGDDNNFLSRYIDGENSPLYPFGHGLGYSRFKVSDISVAPKTPVEQEVVVRAAIQNIGDRAGQTAVQLYIRDRVAAIARPVKELKAFRHVKLNAGEAAELSFTLGRNELGYYLPNGEFILEAGVFEVMIGLSSDDVCTATFELI